MMTASPTLRRRGVTLLEFVLAMGLLVVLSSMTYWFYGSLLSTRERGTIEAQKLRLMRVTLDRMTRELRQVAAVTRDHGVGLRGEAERIWLTTVQVPGRERLHDLRYAAEDDPPEYDLVKVEYKIARHPDIKHEEGWELPLGLARVEINVPRPDSAELGLGLEDDRMVFGGAEGDAAFDERMFDQFLPGGDEGKPQVGSLADIRWEELYAPEIQFLRFCYFDGHSWWDDWQVGGENPLPQLVMITLGFEPRPPCKEQLGRDEFNEEFCECLNEDPVDCEPLGRDQFSVVVRMTQADPLFRSRVSRETQAMMEQLSGGREEESQGGGR